VVIEIEAKAVIAAVPVDAILTAVTIGVVAGELSAIHHTFVTMILRENLNRHGDAALVKTPPKALDVVDNALNVMPGMVNSLYAPVENSGHNAEKSLIVTSSYA